MRTQIDPAQIQVIFADLQTRLIQSSKAVAPADLEKAAAVLLEVVKILDIPFLFSVLSESKAGRLINSLLPASNQKNTFIRTTTSVLLDGVTGQAIQAQKRKVLVICGFTSEVVVAHSVQQAIEHGYEVIVPIDVVSSRSERTEHVAINTMERLGAHISSVMNLATALAPDMSTDVGSSLMEALTPLRS